MSSGLKLIKWYDDQEDLDLLSFSALAPGAPRKNQTEGMPLKAVYRDTVFGLRYLHSREDGAPVGI